MSKGGGALQKALPNTQDEVKALVEKHKDHGHRRVGAGSAWEDLAEQATVVPPESLRAVCGRVLAKLGAAASAPRDAVAARAATAGEETMRALHLLENVLDFPEYHTTAAAAATAVAIASGDLEPISPKTSVGGAPEPVGFGADFGRWMARVSMVRCPPSGMASSALRVRFKNA